MTDALVAGAVAGYGIAVPVGAVGLLLVGLAAREGARVGVAAALGVATADGVFCLLAVVGGGAVRGWVEPVAGPMRWLGAAVLLGWAARTGYTAVRAHRRPPDDGGAGAGVARLSTPGRAYFGLLALTLLNPATVVYFAALVLGERPSGAAVFVAAAFLASASWQVLLAVGGTLVGRVLTGPRGRLGTAVVSGVVVAVLAVRLVW